MKTFGLLTLIATMAGPALAQVTAEDMTRSDVVERMPLQDESAQP